MLGADIGLALTYVPLRNRGAQFDLVVLVDAESSSNGVAAAPRGVVSHIEAAVDRYVAMTRATQQLVILRSS